MTQNILIGISGGIAAYKIPHLVRLLQKQGDNVRIVYTAHAAHFISPTTLQAVSGEAVRHDLFDPAAEQGMGRMPTSSPPPPRTSSANSRTASPTTSSPPSTSRQTHTSTSHRR